MYVEKLNRPIFVKNCDTFTTLQVHEREAFSNILATVFAIFGCVSKSYDTRVETQTLKEIF